MQLIDSYSGTNNLVSQTVYGGVNSQINRYGQSFTGTQGYLNNIVFRLGKNSSPPGFGYVEVYNHTGTFGVNGVPTGGILATSDGVAASSYTSFSDIPFNFSGTNKIFLGNQKYFAVFFYNNGDGTNNSLIISDSLGTATGNVAYQTYSGTTWTALASNDALFSVYIDDFLYINYAGGVASGLKVTQL